MSDAAFITIASSLLCSTVAAIVSHYLTKDRDAATRKSILDRESDMRRRHFRRHTLKCCYTLERISHKKPIEVWSAYSRMAPDILSEAEMIAPDYLPAFDALVRRAGGWRHEDAQAACQNDHTLRDVLIDSIRQVHDYTKNKPA